MIYVIYIDVYVISHVFPIYHDMYGVTLCLHMLRLGAFQSLANDLNASNLERRARSSLTRDSRAPRPSKQVYIYVIYMIYIYIYACFDIYICSIYRVLAGVHQMDMCIYICMLYVFRGIDCT